MPNISPLPTFPAKQKEAIKYIGRVRPAILLPFLGFYLYSDAMGVQIMYNKSDEITEEIEIIVTNAIQTALTFGLGILSTCRNQIELHEFIWTDVLEEYCFYRIRNLEGFPSRSK